MSTWPKKNWSEVSVEGLEKLLERLSMERIMQGTQLERVGGESRHSESEEMWASTQAWDKNNKSYYPHLLYSQRALTAEDKMNNGLWLKGLYWIAATALGKLPFTVQLLGNKLAWFTQKEDLYRSLQWKSIVGSDGKARRVWTWMSERLNNKRTGGKSSWCTIWRVYCKTMEGTLCGSKQRQLIDLQAWS